MRRALPSFLAAAALGCGIKAPPLPPLPEPRAADGGSPAATAQPEERRDGGTPAEPPTRPSPSAPGARPPGADAGTP